MLDELHVRNLGVLEDVRVSLSPGLTVVTGETGAGKTMLVTALQLLLGARGDGSLIRAGEDVAIVEARLVDVVGELAELADDGEVVVTRELRREGRSRVRVGGRLSTVADLRRLLGDEIEVHAQHEHVRLGNTVTQRHLLDRYGGEDHQILHADHLERYLAWRAAQDELQRLQIDERERARELDRLAYEVAEIDRAGIDPEADEQLDDALAAAEHAEEIRSGLLEAGAALGSDGAGEPVGTAVAALRGLPETSLLVPLRNRAAEVAEQVADLSRELREAAEGLEVDPERLDELRDRQQALAQLCRKYGADLAAVVAYGDEARARLGTLRDVDLRLEELTPVLTELTTAAETAADRLRASRERAGARLAAAVSERLGPLALDRARFWVELEPADHGPEGCDQVRFMLAANPGEPGGPLDRAASGGERARVALAVETALARAEDVQVLVFDEVDAGVGGAVAAAVGRTLAELASGAEGRQVLCVTHLAQVAASADRHHVVEKEVREGRTVTTVREVPPEQRADELAQMIGGGRQGAALDHARELLAVARRT